MILRFGTKKISFSQSGEDLIVRRTLYRLGIKKPSYLDVGANDPVKNSNTYLLYKLGFKGVLVEPDPSLAKKLRKKRKRDKILNCGIGKNITESAEFYIFDNDSLNTFSKSEAEKIESYGKNKVLKVVQVPLANINDVIKEYFVTSPNFVTIDVEGLDFGILKSIDYESFRPEIFCVETIDYTQNNTEIKRKEIFEFMESKGYLAFADTYINTIFVDREKWRER